MTFLASGHNNPLDILEIQRLRQYLESDLQNLPAGSMNLSSTYGFLTAVISGPEIVLPSEWMPMVWGYPNFETDAQSKEAFQLMVRLYDEIAARLVGREYCILFDDLMDGLPEGSQANGALWSVASDWSKGYAQGISLEVTEWDQHFEGELDQLLSPVVEIVQNDHLGRQAANVLYGKFPNILDRLTTVAEEIYHYWLRFRIPGSQELVNKHPIQRLSTKVGRNEPCPCGSGLKYKKCCSALAVAS